VAQRSFAQSESEIFVLRESDNVIFYALSNRGTNQVSFRTELSLEYIYFTPNVILERVQSRELNTLYMYEIELELFEFTISRYKMLMRGTALLGFCY
jgi:hypothetical protein